MIGTSIALAVWTTGLLYMTTRSEKKRVLESESPAVEEKRFEVGDVDETKV